LNIPSDVHAVPAVTAVPEPVVPVLAAGAAADVADGVTPEAAAVEATTDAETTGAAVVVPAAGEAVGTVWKTPPETAEAVVAAGEAVVATREAVATVAATAAAQDPVGAAKAEDV
jgi:hypothetical protein